MIGFCGISAMVYLFPSCWRRRDFNLRRRITFEKSSIKSVEQVVELVQRIHIVKKVLK